jgi:hypothetical protein
VAAAGGQQGWHQPAAVGNGSPGGAHQGWSPSQPVQHQHIPAPPQALTPSGPTFAFPQGGTPPRLSPASASPPASQLSPEQWQRAEANRQRALAIRAERQRQAQGQQPELQPGASLDAALLRPSPQASPASVVRPFFLPSSSQQQPQAAPPGPHQADVHDETPPEHRVPVPGGRTGGPRAPPRRGTDPSRTPGGALWALGGAEGCCTTAFSFLRGAVLLCHHLWQKQQPGPGRKAMPRESGSPSSDVCCRDGEPAGAAVPGLLWNPAGAAPDALAGSGRTTRSHQQAAPA